jgi:hypothetical protein
MLLGTDELTILRGSKFYGTWQWINSVTGEGEDFSGLTASIKIKNIHEDFEDVKNVFEVGTATVEPTDVDGNAYKGRIDIELSGEDTAYFAIPDSEEDKYNTSDYYAVMEILLSTGEVVLKAKVRVLESLEADLIDYLVDERSEAIIINDKLNTILNSNQEFITQRDAYLQTLLVSQEEMNTVSSSITNINLLISKLDAVETVSNKVGQVEAVSNIADKIEVIGNNLEFVNRTISKYDINSKDINEITYANEMQNVHAYDALSLSIVENKVFLGSENIDSLSTINNDLTTIENGNDTFSVQSSCDAVQFNLDGSKLYVLSDNSIMSYTLSESYKVSTAVLVGTKDFSNIVSTIIDFRINENNSKIYLMGEDTIFQFSLGVIGDISTAVLDVPPANNGIMQADINTVELYEGYETLSVRDNTYYTYCIRFSADGMKLFNIEYKDSTTSSIINEYSLAAPYAVITRELVSSITLPIGLYTRFDFKFDGTALYIGGDTGANILEYRLSTAFDISTAVYFNTFTRSQRMDEFRITPDGTKMIVDSYGTYGLSIYTMSTAFDLSTLSSTSTLFIGETDSYKYRHFAFDFNDDGSKLYLYDAQGGTNYNFRVFNLSTPYDLTTATMLEDIIFRESLATDKYIKSFNFIDENNITILTTYNKLIPLRLYNDNFVPLSNKLTFTQSVYDYHFNTDGTKLFLLEPSTTKLVEYDLAVAYEIYSISDVVSERLLTEITSQANTMLFVDEGMGLLIGSDDVYRYSLSEAYNISTAILDTDVFLTGNTYSLSIYGGYLYCNVDGGVNKYEIKNKIFPDYTLVESHPFLGAGFMFNYDGSRFYTSESKKLRQYNLDTPYDISSLTSSGFDVESITTSLSSYNLRPAVDGSFILGGSMSTYIYKYTLDGTINTPSHLEFENEIKNPTSFTFNEAETQVFISDSTNIYQYTLGIKEDITTAYHYGVKIDLSHKYENIRSIDILENELFLLADTRPILNILANDMDSIISVANELANNSVGLHDLSVNTIKIRSLASNVASVVINADNIEAIQSASANALSASASAETASTSASEAAASASEALASAETATTKASEASTSAETAITKASEAAASAETATTKASEASTSASEALASKNAAKISEENAAASALVVSAAYTKEEVAGSFGRLSSPLCDIPFNQNTNMKSGTGSVTTTRASTDTKINIYGQMESLATSIPSVSDGLTIEEGSTNLLLNNVLTSDGIGCTYSQGNLGVDGITYFSKYTSIGSATEEVYKDLRLVPSGELTNGKIYTFSIWIDPLQCSTDKVKLRYSYGSEAITIFTISTKSFDNSNGKLVEEANGLYRISLSGTYTTHVNGLLFRVQFVDHVIGSTMSFMFSQGEKLDYASSYIPTTDSAVTRALPFVTLPAKYNLPGPTEGSICFDVKLKAVNQTSYILGVYPNISDYIRVYMGISGLTSVQFRNNSNDITLNCGSYNLDSVDNYVIKWVNNIVYTYLNKVLIDSEVYVGDLFDATKVFTTNIRLGGAMVSSSGQAGNMEFKNFKTYNFALTDTEIKLLQGGN